MREATFTVSPNRQYLGIACPTTPVYVANVAKLYTVHSLYFTYCLDFTTETLHQARTYTYV